MVQHTGDTFQDPYKFRLSYCHDLERISRVPDFFVIFIKHGYYFSGSWTQVLIVISSIGFNCVESCSINSDELMDHQNSADIWKE